MSNLDFLAKAALIENTTKSTKAPYICVNLVGNESRTFEDPYCCYTSGLYHVTYSPYKHAGKIKKPYFIRVDMFTCGITVKDWDDFVRLANGGEYENYYEDKRPEHYVNEKVAFLLKYSNIDKEIFEISKNNLGMAIPFCLDLRKYKESIVDENVYLGYLEGLKIKYRWDGKVDGKTYRQNKEEEFEG